MREKYNSNWTVNSQLLVTNI